MAHALVWTELNSSDLTSETRREIPYAGFGTNVLGSWNKKIFKLKWQNASVENIRVWLDSPYADIYTTTNFPVINKSQQLNLIDDLGFDIRITPLDNFNIIYLPNAYVATNLNITTASIAGTDLLYIPSYIDGKKIQNNSLILVKNQTNSTQNGLYKINSNVIGSGFTYFVSEEILTASRIISIGSSSFYSYMEGYSPNQFVSMGSTGIIWVDRNNTYKLENVVAAGTSNLGTSGTALTNLSLLIDNVTIALNDRILIKDQTDARQNGIYYVSSLYASNQNSIINPNTSGSTLDRYWEDAIFNITNETPVRSQVLFGSTTAGKFYNYYKTQDSQIIPYGILDDGDGGGGGGGGGAGGAGINPGDNAGLGDTLSNAWTDATHFYRRYGVTWYYEVATGSSIGFSYSSSNAGILYSTPSNITNYSNNSVQTAVGQSILVKHYIPSLGGIYVVSGVGSGYTSYWTRSTDFDEALNYEPTIVTATDSRSSIGSPAFYVTKDLTYNNGFVLNQNEINIQPRYIHFELEPVQNVITKEIDNFSRVNITNFNNSGIANSQRVLVAGQATTEAQNGIYTVSNSSSGSTLGLAFYNSYWIRNGALATSSGNATTFFLYSDQDNVSFGAAGVTFVNISSIGNTTVDFEVAVDKVNSYYISPDDFGSNVASGDLVFVNLNTSSVNAGIYTAIVGQAQKAKFNYATGLKNWYFDIYRNILNQYKNGSYVLSPNLRKQIDGFSLGRVKGGFGDSTFANRKYGNVYAPEMLFPSNANSTNFFDSDYLGSSIIQETGLDWKPQDYQSYIVKGVYFRANTNFFPSAAGSAISSKLFDGTLIQNNEDVLVYIGNDSSTANTYNGIWRAVSIGGAGSSVYFKKHEDFDVTTSYVDGTNTKLESSPYERPTKVIIQNGYFIGAAAFAYTTIYMQGLIGYRADTSVLGATATTTNDDSQYNAGQETFTKNSFIRLSRDYAGIGTFPKIAPIQHFIFGDLTNKDTVNGDILLLNRGSKLYTLDENTNVKYYYEIGDRVIYQDENEDVYQIDNPNYVNGIYQIVSINESTWTYYLRKVKQNSAPGHIDHFRRLDVHSNNTIEDNIFSLVKYEGNGTTYYFNSNNYTKLDVFTINSAGITTNYIRGVDYTIYPESGYIQRISSFGISSNDFYCYIYQDDNVSTYSEVPKSLFNKYHLIEKVLIDKERLKSGIAITSGTYSIDNNYFQISNTSGLLTTSDIKNNKDKNFYYKQLNLSNIYIDEISHVVSIGYTNDYFITSRTSQDGYIKKVGNGFTSTFYDTNLFNPSTGRTTGVFTGNFYIEKIDQNNGGIAVSYWFRSLNLTSNENVLILNNNTSSIASTFQTSYYNDNNELIYHSQSGNNDKKIVSYEGESYYPVTLAYDGSMTDPLTPLKVYSGVNTYFLHYNPSSNARSTALKTFYSYANVDIYNCSVASSSNISNLNDFGGSINNYSPSINNLILVKNQSNDKENGIYSVVSNNLYRLDRAVGFSTAGDLKALSKVKYGNKEYELVLPTSTSAYSIGNTAGNTAIAWKNSGYAQTIDTAVVVLGNISGLALTTAFPDTYDGYTLEEDDKVLLVGQTDDTQRYIGRFSPLVQPQLSRVTSSLATTAGFAITNCYVYDENRNKYWELYFNPSQRTIGVGTIHWFEQNYLSEYVSGTFTTYNNVSIGDTPSYSNQQSGDIVLLRNQTNSRENGIYAIDNKFYYYLSRHQNLFNSDQIIPNYKINVTSGFNNTGYYGLSYSETGTPVIGSTNIFWASVYENNVLTTCAVASTENINLSNPPTLIDGVILKNDTRILLKDQTTKTQNGIYVVQDIDNKIWARATDLDENVDLQPQLSVEIDGGVNNIGKVYRIVVPTPRSITNSQSSEYIIGTDNIEWSEVTALGLYEDSPLKWQKIGLGITESLYLGPANMNKFYIAESARFAVAIKSPSAGQFASIGISDSGKVRNLKFKVEYKIKED